MTYVPVTVGRRPGGFTVGRGTSVTFTVTGHPGGTIAPPGIGTSAIVGIATVGNARVGSTTAGSPTAHAGTAIVGTSTITA